MASDYDNQLIESVTVRRQRLLTALLFGENPNERRWLDSLRWFILSVAAAAVIAAVCVGYSFVSDLLAENRAKQEQAQSNQIHPRPSSSRAGHPGPPGAAAAGAAGLPRPATGA